LQLRNQQLSSWWSKPDAPALASILGLVFNHVGLHR
jgi:hypothetical protein